ncbi:MAG: hypothetical protein AAB088_05365, partial [Actinomycetota bacterium]
VRNSELVGLSDREIELIAQIARYHRKGSPKLEHPEFAALGADDQYIVRGLAGILRIAIGLDRTQDGRVTKLSITNTDEDLEISIKTKADTDPDLNVYAANERKALLSEATGLRVKVKSA